MTFVYLNSSCVLALTCVLELDHSTLELLFGLFDLFELQGPVLLDVELSRIISLELSRIISLVLLESLMNPENCSREIIRTTQCGS